MKSFTLSFIFCVQAWSSTHILTSFSILKDISQNISPATFTVSTLVPAGADSHGYQAMAKDYIAIRKADLVLLVGEGFEPWAESLIKKSKTKAKIFYVTQNLKLIPHDPHIWQSPELVTQLVQNLSLYLQTEYPSAKLEIENKTSTYLQEIKLLQSKYKTEFSKIPLEHRKMIISHNSFQYFSQEFGVSVDSPLDVSQEGESSIKKVSEIVGKIKKEKIRSLFIEKSSPEGLMKSIAKSTGTEIAGTLYSDCLSENGPASTYLKMIDYNFNLILNSMKVEKK